MTKTVDQAIAEIQAEIVKIEAELRSKQETVNTLCGVIGRPSIYSVSAGEQRAAPQTIRPDLFFGQPLASAVKVILEMRQSANLGAASISEIHELLVQGGYQFETKSDDIARKSLRNSLVKNTAQFQKLPNGRFGIKSWYPKVRSTRAEVQDNEVDEDSAEEAGLGDDISSTDETVTDGQEAQ